VEYKIYKLVCPITNEVRYIGRTKLALKIRLSHHLREIHNPFKYIWIDNLRKQNKKPVIIQIEMFADKETAYKREKFWINHYIDAGSKLFNYSHDKVIEKKLVYRA